MSWWRTNEQWSPSQSQGTRATVPEEDDRFPDQEKEVAYFAQLLPATHKKQLGIADRRLTIPDRNDRKDLIFYE